LTNRHFPSGFDCESYYTCHNLEFIIQRCLEGFWFHRTSETCRVSRDVLDCEFAPPVWPPATDPPPTQPPTTTTPPATTTPPVTTTPPMTTSADVTTSTAASNSPDLVDCPGSGVSVHIHPFSCTRYFMCFDGWLINRTCSPGLFFSRSQMRCVRRSESDCRLDVDSCPADDDPPNVVFLPDQEDCQKYFVCHQGNALEWDCGPTLHWDPNDNWCIREEESDCEPSYPLPDVKDIECPDDTESDIIFLPHPDECQFYFICIDGESTLVRCGRYTLFDHILGKCFFAESARCFNQ
ncbi:CLUMA_CG020659, isoform A, partial [Clunio marinus]